MEKAQFNVRLPGDLRAATLKIADALDYTRDEIAEVALATLLGGRDEVVKAKWKKAQRTARLLKLAATFNPPDRQHGGHMALAA
jgi:predicted transcriptional regulator